MSGPGKPSGTVGPGQDGVAVFPPSAVSVFLTEEHGSPRNSFAVRITDLEPHGDQIRVHAGGLSADITPAASADLGLTPGMTVYFASRPLPSPSTRRRQRCRRPGKGRTIKR